MRRESVTIKWVMVGLVLAFVAFGCRAAIKPIEEPAGNVYQIAKEAKLTKVNLYQQKGYLWVDVGLKNISNQKQAFRVSVEVDDWPGVSIITGGKNRVPLEAQKEETVTLMTLAKSLPKRLVIEITLYQ